MLEIPSDACAASILSTNASDSKDRGPFSRQTMSPSLIAATNFTICETFIAVHWRTTGFSFMSDLSFARDFFVLSTHDKSSRPDQPRATQFSSASFANCLFPIHALFRASIFQ